MMSCVKDFRMIHTPDHVTIIVISRVGAETLLDPGNVCTCNFVGYAAESTK